MKSYQFRSYIVKDREYFEYVEVDPKLEQITGRKLPITKSDLPLMESLIGFFYLDREELAANCERISTALRAYRPNEDFENFLTIRNGLEELSGKHIFFKLLELDWRERLHQADLHPESFQDYLPINEIEELPPEVFERQQRMEELFTCVMEFGLDKRTVAERMADFSSVKVLQDEKTFPFSKLTVGYEWVSVAAVTEVLYPESVFDLVDFYLRECIRREIPLRRCKSCGRWFALTGHQGWEYCTRVFDDKGRTCRDVGAINTWTAKRSEDEVFKIYRREYKKRFGWIKAGKIAADDFYRWSEQARLKKLACDKGEITLEEFTAWLGRS